MKNFDEFADKFLESPSPFTTANEEILIKHLSQYFHADLAKDLIQFQKNYSLLLVEEYHKWINKDH